MVAVRTVHEKIDRNQEWADASAKDAGILMSSLQNFAPQLENISLATKYLDEYGASIIRDLALGPVWSFLPNVKNEHCAKDRSHPGR